MKETDDDNQVDGSDEGAIPSTSTNTSGLYEGIFEFHKAMRRIDAKRSTELRGVNQDRRTDENLSEDSDT